MKGARSLIILFILSFSLWNCQFLYAQEMMSDYEKGLKLYNSKNFKDAIPFFELSIKYKPEPETYHLLAHCYKNEKRWSDAERAFGQARLGDPGNKQYIDCQANFFLDYGTVLSEKNINIAAIQYLKKSLELKRSEMAFHAIAHAFEHEDQLKNAEDSYGEAIRLNPSNGLHYFCRGIFYFHRREKYDKALRDLDDSLSTEKTKLNKDKESKAYFIRGIIRIRQNNYSGAVDTLKKAASLCPSCIDHNSSLTYTQLYENTLSYLYRKEKELLEEQTQGQINAFYANSQTLIIQGRLEEAKLKLEKALALKPDDPRCKVAYDNVLQLINNREVARLSIATKNTLNNIQIIISMYYKIIIFIIVLICLFFVYHRRISEWLAISKARKEAYSMLLSEFKKTKTAVTEIQRRALKAEIKEVIKKHSHIIRTKDALDRQTLFSDLISKIFKQY